MLNVRCDIRLSANLQQKAPHSRAVMSLIEHRQRALHES